MGRWKGKHHYTLKERFEKLFIPEPNVGCWLWIGATHRRNNLEYGNMRDEFPSKKTILAHRVSWIIHRGFIPQGIQVLHKCDITICVNPDHLFLGTQADNIHDCCNKKRHAYGEKTWNSKLTDIDVKTIRESKKSNTELARFYHVSQPIISYAKNRKTWKHV